MYIYFIVIWWINKIINKINKITTIIIIKIMAALSNNSIEIYTSGLQSTEQPTVQNAVIDLHGHRSDIRTLALSSDDEMLLSGSNSKYSLH